MRLRTLFTTAALVVTVGVIASGTAYAETVSASAGPVPIAGVPVDVCVDGDCQTTPALSSATLEATATTDTATAVPTITPGLCTGGTGPTLTIATGADEATVSGEISGTTPDGSPFSQTIDPVTVPADSSATISACASGTPPVPPVPEPTGLLDVLLNLVQQLLETLLGGLPGLPSLPGTPGVPGIPSLPLPGL